MLGGQSCQEKRDMRNNSGKTVNLRKTKRSDKNRGQREIIRKREIRVRAGSSGKATHSKNLDSRPHSASHQGPGHFQTDLG